MQQVMTMKHWMLGFSLIILGGGMSACAMGGASWMEEVQLHDGSKLIAERSQRFGGRHEIGQKPPIKEEEITFSLPGSSESITWASEFSEDVGRAYLLPLALHISNKTPYIIATPNLCLAYNKWGRPNPPYVIFKQDGKAWRQIPLPELPVAFKEINLVINTTKHDSVLAHQTLVRADVVKKLNSSLSQPEYQSIVREPLKPGVGCPELVYYKGGWVGPGDSIGRRMMDRMSK